MLNKKSNKLAICDTKSKRLWHDIKMLFGHAYYQIKDNWA
jgi:hypothetical protein